LVFYRLVNEYLKFLKLLENERFFLINAGRLLHLTKRSKLLKKVKIVKTEVCEAIINMMEVASTTFADIIEDISNSAIFTTR